MSEPASTPAVEVLWRPGCPYCDRLRRGLRRAGVPTTERNIWADPAAAAQVRAVTGGDETVPTVLVSSRGLVNPSLAAVLDAIRSELPDLATQLSPVAPASAHPSPRAAVGWTLALTLGWLVLAAWRPTTTWHLGPALAAAVAPWLIGQDGRTGDRWVVPRLAAAGAGGFLVAAAATVALARTGLLRGPTVLGFPDPWIEALALAGAGAVLAVGAGALRARRTPTGTRSAWVGDRLLVRSDDVVTVEGNVYFPASAIAPGLLAPTSTRTVCPWKGVAHYYTVTIDGVEHVDTAWCYRRPALLARRVKGRIAFWGGVEIRGGD